MGEAEVTFPSRTNNLEKGAGHMDTLTTNGNFEERPHQGRLLAELIDSYMTDPVSSYHRLRYQTRRNHKNLLLRLKEQQGHRLLSDERA